MKKNYVAQEDPMGCGVACVANRLGISYAEALKLFDRPEDARTIGYKCRYIVEALRRGGVDARLHHIKHSLRHVTISGRDPEITGAIVLLVRSERYPYQHYLLKTAEGSGLIRGQICMMMPMWRMHLPDFVTCCRVSRITQSINFTRL